MFVPFKELNDSSRIWVYQSSRILDNNEAEFLANSMESFLGQWRAHGQPLQASYLLVDNLFLIVAVDEQSYGASGCSIDASVHEVKRLQQQLGLDFFRRDIVVFKTHEGIRQINIKNIKEQISSGQLRPDSLVYNTLVERKGDLQTKWLLETSSSWLRRYFKTVDTLE